MIFLSYRREDSGDLALALAEKLATEFGQDAVFLDRYGIEPGSQWKERIHQALGASKVVLALIGSRWLKCYDEYGQRRIDRDDDVLAFELATALSENPVLIPLYLHGTKPLPPEALPPRLKGLAGKQGISFDLLTGFDALVRQIEQITGAKARDHGQPPPPGAGGPLAKPWHMPDSIGELFKGRGNAIQKLHERFADKPAAANDLAARRQIVCGLGGIGKTRLAIEYAWAYRDEYQAALFVVADTPDQLRRSLSELSDPSILNLPEWKCPDEGTRMGAVIRWLCEHPRWLIIIDNADEDPSVDAVQAVLPKLRGGDVIITSRNSAWGASTRNTRCELDVLPPEAAVAFLLDRTDEQRRKTPQDQKVAAELASELGYLALAMEQAGAYIQHHDGGLSLADYLARWREGDKKVRGYCNERLMHYGRSVGATWETTVSALSPPALALFRVLAWFSPNPIPRQMLLSSGAAAIIRKAMPADSPSAVDLDAEEALAQLIAYSMTKKTEEQGVPCVGLHRLVLTITRDLMPADVRIRTIVAAAELLVCYAPKDSYRPETWQDWRLLIAHAEAVWEEMEKLDSTCWNLELMKLLALYYLGQDRDEESVPLQRKVLDLVQRRLPPDDPQLFLAKNDLALMMSGAAPERASLFREALAGRRALGEITEDTAETMHNYGSFLVTTGQMEEAEPMLRRALEIHTHINGPLHWRTLMAESGYADLLSRKGDYAAAEPLHRHAVEGTEKTLGFGHRDTFNYASRFCSHLEATGRDDESKSLKLRCLMGRGLSPEATALERRVMAYTCLQMGAYAEAEKLLNTVLAVGFEVPGTHCHLARVCLLLNRADEARSHGEEAWKYRADAPPYVLPRILWLRILFAAADRRADESSALVGQLKTVFQKADVCIEWTMDAVLAELRKGIAGELSAEATALLEGIIAALHDPSKLPALDQIPLWRDAVPQPLA